jgi:hypothetical protein
MRSKAHVHQPGDLLPVPPHGDMSDPQFKGTACVWCAVTLSTDTAVDLGQRRVRFLDGHITVSPRACRPCTAERVPGVIQQHTAMCEQCADGPPRCDTASALHRLALEASQ